MVEDNEIVDLALQKFKKMVRQMPVCLESMTALSGTLVVDNHRFVFVAIGALTYSNLDSAIAKLMNRSRLDNKLIIAGSASQTIKEQALERGVSVLDAGGNALMFIPGKLYINIQGQKAVKCNSSAAMNFRMPGIKVLFYLLGADDKHIPNMRAISDATDASIGTVKNVMDVLKANEYVMDTSKGQILTNQSRLLEEWVMMFNQQLRAKIVIGRGSFVGDSRNWKDVVLPDGMMWGGECGAFLLNGYMTPGAFCIYSQKPQRDLALTKAIVPNTTGKIILYNQFWKHELTQKGKALLCYADLMSTNDSRCHEAAKKLRDEELRDK